MIDAGLLGTLHYGEIDYYHGIGPWYGQYRWNTKRELGGSALLTAGCHALDALLLCMGSDVEEVTSYATPERESDLQRLRIPDHVDDDPEVQARRPWASAPRWWTACSPTTSTRTSSAAKAACSTTSSTRRSSTA